MLTKRWPQPLRRWLEVHKRRAAGVVCGRDAGPPLRVRVSFPPPRKKSAAEAPPTYSGPKEAGNVTPPLSGERTTGHAFRPRSSGKRAALVSPAPVAARDSRRGLSDRAVYAGEGDP